MVAEKKRGGNSSPAIFMRSTAALFGVALGVVSCLAWYDPVPVHADVGEFAGAVDYICALEGAEASALSTTGGAFTAGAILGIYLCTRNPIQTGGNVAAENIAFYSGMYTNQNVLKRGVLVSMSGTWSGQDGYDFAYSDDFDLYLTATGVPTNLICEAYDGPGQFKKYNLVFTPTYSGADILSVGVSNRHSSSGCLTGQYVCMWGRSYMGLVCSIDLLTIPELYGVTLQSACTGADFNVNTSKVNILGGGAFYRLPSGDLDLASPDTYINEVLRPYVEETYPEYVYLLPQEPEPSSEYATEDIVPGIPKDWTIINPELPTSPHLDLTIPEGDFQAIDPGDTFTGFASGVGFWWSMVNEILTTFHIKTLALALLAVAVAIFALYKIGG